MRYITFGLVIGLLFLFCGCGRQSTQNHNSETFDENNLAYENDQSRFSDCQLPSNIDIDNPLNINAPDVNSQQSAQTEVTLAEEISQSSMPSYSHDNELSDTNIDIILDSDHIESSTINITTTSSEQMIVSENSIKKPETSDIETSIEETRVTSKVVETTNMQTEQTSEKNINYQHEMRLFVQQISSYAKSQKTGFLIVPQNGEDIISTDETNVRYYLSAIDGIGREDFLYGGLSDDEATPKAWTKYIKAYLDVYKSKGLPVLITDYCYSKNKVDHSYELNNTYGYLSLAADSRELDLIPVYPENPYLHNNMDINKLGDASNFLYLINPGRYPSKQAMISSLSITNYDVLIIDLFVFGIQLTRKDVELLQKKTGGQKRLVLAYMSIGEAEAYRYYWEENWLTSPPAWLEKENQDWEDNYKVKYWDPQWKAIIYGSSDAYTDRIIKSGFDGVYMDIIDAYEYFEEIYD